LVTREMANTSFVYPCDCTSYHKNTVACVNDTCVCDVYWQGTSCKTNFADVIGYPANFRTMTTLFLLTFVAVIIFLSISLLESIYGGKKRRVPSLI